MEKKSFITPDMSIARISDSGEITALSSDFRMNKDTPFTLFIHPIGATDQIVEIVRVELYAGAGFMEFPIALDDWTPCYFSAIEAGGIDLTQYKVWWGTGGKAKVAE